MKQTYFLVIATFFLLFAVWAITADCRPTFEAFRGFDRLRAHSSRFARSVSRRDANGQLETVTVHADDFTFQDGDDLVTFRYEAEVSPDANVVRLDEENDVEAVSCHGLGYRQPNMMHLHTNSSQAAQRVLKRLSHHANTLMAGGHEWNCKTATDDLPHGSSILRRVVAAHLLAENSSVIVVETQIANHADFFKSLSVQFASSMLPTADVFAPRDPRVIPKAPSALNKRFWGSFFSAIWSSIKTLAGEVLDVITMSVKAFTVLVTGDLEVNKHMDLIHSQDALLFSFDNGLECRDCAVSLDLGVDFVLEIQDYTLLNASVIVAGDMNVDIGAGMQFEWSQRSSATMSIGTYRFRNIGLGVVGIPLVLSFEAPVSAEYDLDVSAPLTANTAIQCSGQLQFGLQYDYDSGTFMPVNKHNYTHTGPIQNLVNDVNINLQLALLIVPVVRVDYVVYAHLGIKPYLSLSINYDDRSTACPDTGTSVLVNWGVQVSAGANFSLRPVLNWNYGYGPVAIAHFQRPLYAGCVGGRYHATPFRGMLSLIPGMSWYGEQSRLCPRSITLQYLGVGDDRKHYMLLSENLVVDNGNWCLAQILYQAELYGGNISLNPVLRDADYVEGYSECQDPTTVVTANPLRGQVSANFSQIRLSDDVCVQINLQSAHI